MTECFLIEPVFDESEALSRTDTWNQTGHPIKAWRNPEDGKIKAMPADFGPGAIYRAIFLQRNFTWDNETEPHLYVQLPFGGWDIDGRATNCSMPYDRTHRCWARSGIPPRVSVSKGPNTCSAGVIDEPIYHNLLMHGRILD